MFVILVTAPSASVIIFFIHPPPPHTGWPQTWKTWNTQGFLWAWKTQEILCNLREKCNKQSIFSSSFRYLCKTAVDWVNKVLRLSDMVRVRWWPVILLELMWNDPWWRSLLHLLFVAITYGTLSLWLWKSLKNSEFFSPTLWPPCVFGA